MDKMENHWNEFSEGFDSGFTAVGLTYELLRDIAIAQEVSGCELRCAQPIQVMKADEPDTELHWCGYCRGHSPNNSYGCCKGCGAPREMPPRIAVPARRDMECSWSAQVENDLRAREALLRDGGRGGIEFLRSIMGKYSHE